MTDQIGIKINNVRPHETPLNQQLGKTNKHKIIQTIQKNLQQYYTIDSSIGNGTGSKSKRQQLIEAYVRDQHKNNITINSYNNQEQTEQLKKKLTLMVNGIPLELISDTSEHTATWINKSERAVFDTKIGDDFTNSNKNKQYFPELQQYSKLYFHKGRGKFYTHPLGSPQNLVKFHKLQHHTPNTEE